MDGQKAQLDIEDGFGHIVSENCKPWKEWKQGNTKKEKYLRQ